MEVEAVEKFSPASSPLQAPKGLCRGSPLRAEIEARAPDRLDAVTAQGAQAVAARFGGPALGLSKGRHIAVAPLPRCSAVVAFAQRADIRFIRLQSACMSASKPSGEAETVAQLRRSF